MNVLVLGSGGREHALAWKISQSTQCDQVFVHPGNAGIKKLGFSNLGEVPISDKIALTRKARECKISLVLIGPENLLAEGYSDTFVNEGYTVFGPSERAARIETSKIYAKELMVNAGIPTASYTILNNEDCARKYLQSHPQLPSVLKLDGIAAGKGVVVAKTEISVETFFRRIWSEKEFGTGPHRVLVEQYLEGKEVSFIGICDGKTWVPLPPATDYKRVYDHDRGPNTGGMGSICPSPYSSLELEHTVKEKIIAPLFQALQSKNINFRGALYVGAMILPNGQPYVLEFNARFGDPEIQAILLRLESDLLPLLYHAAIGNLQDCPMPKWSDKESLYVVLAAEGYPGKASLGDRISLPQIDPADGQLFFSGVSEHSGLLVTSAGRVLGVGATGQGFQSAREKAYKIVKDINWRGVHYRSDIGRT